MIFFLNLKQQLAQCLSAILSVVQQTVVNEAIDVSRLVFMQRVVISTFVVMMDAKCPL